MDPPQNGSDGADLNIPQAINCEILRSFALKVPKGHEIPEAIQAAQIGMTSKDSKVLMSTLFLFEKLAAGGHAVIEVTQACQQIMKTDFKGLQGYAWRAILNQARLGNGLEQAAEFIQQGLTYNFIMYQIEICEILFKQRKNINIDVDIISLISTAANNCIAQFDDYVFIVAKDSCERARHLLSAIEEEPSEALLNISQRKSDFVNLERASIPTSEVSLKFNDDFVSIVEPNQNSKDRETCEVASNPLVTKDRPTVVEPANAQYEKLDITPEADQGLSACPSVIPKSSIAHADIKNEFELLWQGLEKSLPQDMIDTFGGVEAVTNLPIIDPAMIFIKEPSEWDTKYTIRVRYLDLSGFTAPIMRGTDKKGYMFMSIRFSPKDELWIKETCPYFATLFRIDGQWKLECQQHGGHKKPKLGLGDGAKIEYGYLKSLILEGKVEIHIPSNDPQDWTINTLILH